MGALFYIPWTLFSFSIFQEVGGAQAERRRGHELVRALEPQTLEWKYGTLTALEWNYGTLTALEWKYGTLTALKWKYGTLTPIVLEQKYETLTQMV